MFRTSGFMDDVMFSCNGPHGSVTLRQRPGCNVCMATVRIVKNELGCQQRGLKGRSPRPDWDGVLGGSYGVAGYTVSSTSEVWGGAPDIQRFSCTLEAPDGVSYRT